MGPLAGFRIIEVGGIGPAQLCGMLLADMGADVLRIERSDKPDLGIGIPSRFNLMNRSRPAIAIDIRSDNGKELLLKLCESADALFEGFRPGVMERLGLGPRECMARNEKLVFGRMTGWGQDGPLADAVGADELVCNRLEMKSDRATGRLMDPVVGSEIAGQWARDFARERAIDLDASRGYGGDHHAQRELQGLRHHGPVPVGPGHRQVVGRGDHHA